MHKGRRNEKENVYPWLGMNMQSLAPALHSERITNLKPAELTRTDYLENTVLYESYSAMNPFMGKGLKIWDSFPVYDQWKPYFNKVYIWQFNDELLYGYSISLANILNLIGEFLNILG